MIPALLGAGAGAAQVLLPTGLGVVVLIVAAFVAGVVLPEQPMTAAGLFVLPAIVVGFAQVLLDGSSAIGSFLFGSIVSVMFVGILTHFAAGIVLRRRPEQLD